MSATILDRVGPVASSISNDPDFAEILEFYLASMSEKEVRIREMVRTGDFVSLQREAHQIRGSAANYGFPQLSDLSREVEEACRRGDFASAQRQADDMADFIGRMTQS